MGPGGDRRAAPDLPARAAHVPHRRLQLPRLRAARRAARADAVRAPPEAPCPGTRSSPMSPGPTSRARTARSSRSAPTRPRRSGSPAACGRTRSRSRRRAWVACGWCGCWPARSAAPRCRRSCWWASTHCCSSTAWAAPTTTCTCSRSCSEACFSRCAAARRSAPERSWRGRRCKATGGLALPFLWLGARHRGAVVRGALIAAGAVLAISAVAFGSDVLRALAPFGEQASTTNVRSFPGQVAEAFLGRDSVPAGHPGRRGRPVRGPRGPRVPAGTPGQRLDRRRRVDHPGAAAHADLGDAVVHRLAAPVRRAQSADPVARGDLACGAFLLVVHLPYPPN